MDTTEAAVAMKKPVASSTPHGIGGIAVVRVSGSKAIPIVSKAWRGINLATAKSHTAHLGTIVDNEQRPLDQVVATIFPLQFKPG